MGLAQQLLAVKACHLTVGCSPEELQADGAHQVQNLTFVRTTNKKTFRTLFV